MCTRFYFDNSISELGEYYEKALSSPTGKMFAVEFSKPLIPMGEVRPTDAAVVLAPNKSGILDIFVMKWGYTIELPKTSAVGNPGSLIINARSESANEKKSFKDSWAQRRCIIPCAYYFEWKHQKNAETGKTETKEKYLIQQSGSEITYLAGLYRIENGIPVFVVLTAEPSPELSEIHDRMPVLLPKSEVKNWISHASNPSLILEKRITDTVMERLGK